MRASNMKLPRRPTRASRECTPGLAQIYWKEGNLEFAAKQFAAELERYPADPVSNCLLGEILLKKNDAAGAIPHFRAAIDANPQYKEALFDLGKAELSLDRPQEAISMLEKAIKLDHDYVQAHYALGRALRSVGRSAEALQERAAAEQIQARQRANYTKKLDAESSGK